MRRAFSTRRAFTALLCAWMHSGMAWGSMVFCDGFEDGDLTANPAWQISGAAGTANVVSGGHDGSLWNLEVTCDGSGNNADVAYIPIEAGEAFTVNFWIRQREDAYPIAQFGVCDGDFSDADRVMQVTVNLHDLDGLWYLNFWDYIADTGEHNQTQIQYDDSRWYQVEMSRNADGLWTFIFDKEGANELTSTYQDAMTWTYEEHFWIRGGCYYNPGGSYVDDVCVHDDSENNAVYLDGSTGYGTIPDDPAYAFGTEDFTLEALVRFNSIPADSQTTILAKDAVANEEYLVLEYSYPENQRFYFGGRGGDIEWNSGISGFFPVTDSCYHVAGVRSGDDFIFYLNGEEIDTQNLADVGDPSNPGNWDVGRLSTSSIWRLFPGMIDELRVWNDARTPVEIAQYDRQVLTGLEDNLVGYWRFDEGAGVAFADSSPTGNAGTLTGGYTWDLTACPTDDPPPVYQDPPWCDDFEDGDHDSLQTWHVFGDAGTAGITAFGHDSDYGVEVMCDGEGNNPDILNTRMGTSDSFLINFVAHQRPEDYPILHVGIADGEYDGFNQVLRMTVNRHDLDGNWYLNHWDYVAGSGDHNVHQITYDDSRWYNVEVSRSDDGLWCFTFDVGGEHEFTRFYQDSGFDISEPWLWLEGGCYYNPGGSYVDDVCVQEYAAPMLTADFWIMQRTPTYSIIDFGFSEGQYSGTNRGLRAWFGMHDLDGLWHFRLWDNDNQQLYDEVMDWEAERWIPVRMDRYADGNWFVTWDLGGPHQQTAGGNDALASFDDPYAWFSPQGYYAVDGGFYLDDLSISTVLADSTYVIGEAWDDGEWTSCLAWEEYENEGECFAIVPYLGHDATPCIEGFENGQMTDNTALYASLILRNEPPAPVTDLAIEIDEENSAVLSWSPVSVNACGDPILTDGYIIYYNERWDTEGVYDEAIYYYLSYVTTPGFTHYRVADFATEHYYFVTTYNGDDPRTLGVREGMPRTQVRQLLSSRSR